MNNKNQIFAALFPFQSSIWRADELSDLTSEFQNALDTDEVDTLKLENVADKIVLNAELLLNRAQELKKAVQSFR